MQPAARDSLSTTINVNNEHSPPRVLLPTDPAATTTNTTTTVNTAAAQPSHSPSDDNRVVRSIPPWVRTEEDDDDDEDDGASGQHHRLLPPSSAMPASHHYLPAPPHQHRAPGRKWDHLRDAEPAMLDQPIDVNQRRWLPYMVSGPHPGVTQGARIVSDAWMDEHMPHMTAEWTPGEDEEATEKAEGYWLLSPARQRHTFYRIQRIILKNPYVPLVFRLTVLAFTLAGLGLGARVYHEANSVTRASGFSCNKRASTYMAIILDSIAVPYICYITWDEYLSKPLGLRSATAKVSLLLIDLYFIVFYSSNLSLAFDSLDDPRWACFDNESQFQNCPNSAEICHSQKGLAGVLVVALVAWLITFMISVLRVVERLR
ncbi:hypothetical protein AAFC00_000423 [Neodothiora populina]|uniref:Regulator of phospholipase D SRF1 n=1 Tax=Neodothiora populina TaxID=2781224 RepID=A0ABR3PCV1_9PEZI